MNTLRGGQQRWWKGWKACPKWAEAEQKEKFLHCKAGQTMLQASQKREFPMHVSVQEAFG